jgi:hypothetical protein
MDQTSIRHLPSLSSCSLVDAADRKAVSQNPTWTETEFDNSRPMKSQRPHGEGASRQTAIALAEIRL